MIMTNAEYAATQERLLLYTCLERAEAERDALKARLAVVFGHKWRLSGRTTPSGKVLHECEVCGLEDPAPVKMELEARPCVPELKELRARLAEVEAQTAKMREALTEALSLVDASNDCPCPDCTEDRRIQEHIHSALSSGAGRETAERLRCLEQERDQLRAERDALKARLAEAQAEIAELKAAVEFVEDAFGTL